MANINVASYYARANTFISRVYLEAASVNTSNLQATANNLAANGGGYIELPRGNFVVSSLTIPDNIYLVGQGKATKLLANTSMTGVWINLANGATNISISDIELDYQYNANGQHIIQSLDSKGVRIERVTFSGVQNRNALRFNWDNANTLNGHLLVKNCRVENANGGGLMMSIPSVKGIYNVRILDNYIHGGGSMCYMVKSGVTTWANQGNTYFNTYISGNEFIGNGTGLYGPIPMEVWGHNDSIFSGNRISNATRGIGISQAMNIASENNVFYNQNAYCYEIGQIRDVLIAGNQARECASFMNDNSSDGEGTYRLKIRNNNISGTGFSSNQSSVDVIKFNQNQVYEDIQIENNSFHNMNYARSIIRVDGSYANTKRISIKNNYFYTNSEFTTFNTINVRYGQSIRVEDNSIIFNANLTSNNISSGGEPTAIAISLANTDTSDVSVRNNYVKYTGASNNLLVAIGQGHAASAGAADKISIIGNRIEGAYGHTIKVLSSVSDAIVMNNDVSRATGNITLSNTVVHKNLTRIFNSDAMPTTGTFAVGDFVLNSNSQYDAEFNITVGWIRLSSGNGHVVETDWRPISAYSV